MKNLKINIPEGYEIDKEKSTFENIVFKKKEYELPKNLIDLGEVEGYYVGKFNTTPKTTNYSAPDALLWKEKKQAKASISLAHLSYLRDVYRQGWLPDWSDVYEAKFCINFNNNNAVVVKRETKSDFLSFQDRETADLFLKNFYYFIEGAKPLMS